MNHRDLIKTGLILASGGVVLAACSSAPAPNAALSQAEAAYSTASNDPLVQRSAPYELQDADESLQTAKKMWSDNDDKVQVDHYSYLAQRYSEVAVEQAKYRAAAAQVANASRTITLSDMMFATGKADLNDQGMHAVHELAIFMRNRPDRIVNIMGYTDSTGSAELNAALSQRRAAAVQQALVAQGIDGSRVQAHGLGPSNPVASNETADGRQHNRRVEVAISVAGTMPGVGSSSPR